MGPYSDQSLTKREESARRDLSTAESQRFDGKSCLAHAFEDLAALHERDHARMLPGSVGIRDKAKEG